MNHLIERAQVELTIAKTVNNSGDVGFSDGGFNSAYYDTTAEAFTLQQKCSDLLQGDLVGIIEHLSDIELPENVHLVIDNMTLDLGLINADSFEKVFVEKFEQAFSSALKAHISNARFSSVGSGNASQQSGNSNLEELNEDIRSSDSSRVGSLSKKPVPAKFINDEIGYNLAIVSYFLRHGAFPWYARQDSRFNVEELLEALENLPTNQLPRALSPLIEALNHQSASDRLSKQADFATQQSLYNKLYSKTLDTGLDWEWLFNTFDVIDSALKQRLWQQIWQLAAKSHHQNQFDKPLADALSAPLITNHEITQNVNLIAANLSLGNNWRHSLVAHLSLVLLAIRTKDPIKTPAETIEQRLADTAKEIILKLPQLSAPKTSAEIKTRLIVVLDNIINQLELPLKAKGGHLAKASYKAPVTDHHIKQEPFITTSDNSGLSHLNQREQIKSGLNQALANDEIPLIPNLRDKNDVNALYGNEDVNIIMPASNTGKTVEKNDQTEAFTVYNAGLIIFWPYLGILFETLKLSKNNTFNNEQTQQKALHLLAYLVTGNEQTDEGQLLLNKILCNWPLEKPVDRFIKLSAKEKTECDQLIATVIQHWSILGNTSVESLRESFLLRAGRISKQDNGWLLRVETGPYDMLVDKLPWGISLIKLSWMEQMLHVEWRYG